MNLQNSYFTLNSPLLYLDRWLNQFDRRQLVSLAGKPVEVNWTGRAQRELEKRSQPLVIEMQLYFSCVVKKRVVFHDAADIETTPVNGHMQLAYRAIQSAVCDPESFARDYPAARQLDSNAAMKMQPSKLDIDYRKGHWLGEMGFRHRA